MEVKQNWANSVSFQRCSVTNAYVLHTSWPLLIQEKCSSFNFLSEKLIICLHFSFPTSLCLNLPSRGCRSLNVTFVRSLKTARRGVISPPLRHIVTDKTCWIRGAAALQEPWRCLRAVVWRLLILFPQIEDANKKCACTWGCFCLRGVQMCCFVVVFCMNCYKRAKRSSSSGNHPQHTLFLGCSK